MSLFFDATVTCGQCGAATSIRLAGSVNADNRPDLRTAIVDGAFQADTCPGCGTRLRLPVHLSYLDMGRGNWILTEGAERLAEWREIETAAQSIFEQSYGAGVSPLAQELGEHDDSWGTTLRRLERRQMNCRLPARDTIFRIAAGASRRAHVFGSATAGVHRVSSTASVGVWRSVC